MKKIPLARVKLERIVTKQGSTFGFEILTANYKDLGLDFLSLTPKSRTTINLLLRNQLKTLVRFQRENKSTGFKPGQVLFINVEPWQLEDLDICKDIALVHRYLNQSGINLCIELTEREFEELRFHAILKNLFYLKEKGLKIAVDDYIIDEITWRTLLVKCMNCVDFLKVDITTQVDKGLFVKFVSGLVSQPIIIFEKIETKKELQAMRDFQVETPLLQGFLFN
ncbi:EAL domain-containing protein [Vibrio sp. Sgm 22]|uniref:EAL domain-containing protein n=1 Tax=unclassified Vibrio TaxID=2614977 RepID=UPI002249403D|nr:MULTISPECIES: EAL domain-containing protein [unclassified Vibrio]MCX2757776.1 EAL domain-containing protein [Vibrio sp. 14G-20]MCX2774946.1 EAL domain-containing protein [Vibrio sp. Sgm 22]